MAEEICFGLEKKRYETRGIAERLPLECRFLLWQFIDGLAKEVKLDYLQVFEFSIGKSESGEMVQRLVHKQEEQMYECCYEFALGEEQIVGKVFVIDDSVQCTMMWAEEY